MQTEVLNGAAQVVLEDRYRGWIGKEAASHRLHCTVRNIELMVERGELRKIERPRAGKRPETLVSLDQVEEIERRKPHTFALPEPSTAIARAEVLERIPAMVESLTRAIRPAPPAMNLDLDAAAEASGLPKRLLTRAIRDGRLAAHRWAGSYFVHRADLEAFRPEVAKASFASSLSEEADADPR